MNTQWSSPILTNNKNQVTLFDDFLGANYNVNQMISPYFGGLAVGGGGVLGGVLGSQTPDVAGRFGLITLSTGPTNNSTGQGSIDCQTAQFYAGSVGMTMQFGFKITTLATVGVDYVLEMGFGTGYVSGGTGLATNGAALVYKRSTSTNFQAITSSNSTQTIITTADSADFAVTANTWFNGKIFCHPDGTAVDFYVAPIGGPYVLLGTSTTNLPASGFQANPFFTIYKASSTATASTAILDWVQFDITGFNR